jgi:hypothetical protein
MVSELHGLNERRNQARLEKDAATVEPLMPEDDLRADRPRPVPALVALASAW